MAYGIGLRSIRVRFALAVAGILAAYSLAENPAIEFLSDVFGMEIPEFALELIAVFTCSALVFLMATRLLLPIKQLKASTEAIAEGDFESPVDVDCQCEIGGLADSFRTMVTRLNDNVSRIHTLAYEDGITGLPNRRALGQLLEEIGDAKGAMIFIDIDNFKQVNDALGHEVGDEVLRESGRRILTGVKAICTDECAPDFLPTLYRFSGDEFALVLQGDGDAGAAMDVTKCVLASFDEPMTISGNRVQLTATAGIALLGDANGAPEDVVKYANMALAEAKKCNRGGIRLFDAGIRARAIERAFMEGELRHAIREGELRVHYQPKIDTLTSEIAGVEALVRWQHPQKGLLFPAAFMSIAERAGLVEAIGVEVARIAAIQLREWEKLGINWPLSLNVCPSQFVRREFSEQVLDYLKQIDLPTERLELELTETIAMSDTDLARLHLDRFREAGIKISIDDYGVGYSNLAQLYQLPFDILKIDRSLVDSIGIERRGEFIIDSTITMAKALGHKVVAEGVETVEQFEFLKQAKCDIIQGYYFARPMSGEDIVAWMQSRKAGQARQA